jgi:hypothetical protein
LQTAGEFLHPIAEAIGNMMGVPVAIMMPVPIPEKNGEIECLRWVTLMCLLNGKAHPLAVFMSANRVPSRLLRGVDKTPWVTKKLRNHW